MLSLFGARLSIDRDELEWQFATFKWLRLEFGSAARPLVLPSPAFFPASSRQGHGRIADLFEHVRAAAGMEDWPCELQAGRRDRPAQIGPALLLRHEDAPAPCGTFQITGEDGIPKVVITYNPELANDTTAMIATLAHELAHYLMSTAATDPPGGWDLHELHTDLAATWMGFGIFLANSARNFAQFQSDGLQGWSSRTQGYLSEQALVTGLAIVERLYGRDPLTAAPFLKTYLESDLRRATKALARLHPDIPAAVGAVDLAQYGAS
ncbi:hypothetical protein [Allosphingosinicella deserti]|uniref:Uncharacterized protein n=1 Tax=Allosphingosinicella deserti TaxID=2116704 RepID=A0A2P7QI56_9SPHN|nr:hypothetical protein [Sphingomonas deserti]PSJ37620.1 hypothetical protein C7I55_21345 [Sphingomonas deserti]